MILRVIRAILKKWWLVILFPLVMAITVYWLTRHETKIYDSKMTIFTGISNTSVGLDDNVKLDFFTANNAMDNLIAILKARNTIEDASMKLLASHLSLVKSDSAIISRESFRQLKATVPESIFQQVRVLHNTNATEVNLRQYMLAHPNSVFHELLENNPHYSIDKILDKIKAVRRASSDMIDISYESDDAGICQQTLQDLAEAYFARYGEMKKIQNASAVEYFERQLKEAFLKLQDSENRLKDFITEHKILNYYEQGKSLAIYEKEEEQEQQDVRQLAMGADAVLKKLEQKLASNKQRSITVDSLSSLRDEANNLRFRIQSMMLDPQKFKTDLDNARKELQGKYSQISGTVANLYMEDYSIDGIPSSQILGEWMKQYMEKEKQLTYLEQVTASKNMVSDRIQGFAPLGAGLKRLEREVSVNENQYISILHGLNMANLQRQSLEQASSQQLIDEPYFPNTARSSKRMMLVVASAFVGLILVIAFIISRIAFDNTLQNSTIAAQKTGLKVIAALPGSNKSENTLPALATIDMVANQLANEILVATAHIHGRAKKLCIYQSLHNDYGDQLLLIVHNKLKVLNYTSAAFGVGVENGIQKLPVENGVITNLNWEQISKLQDNDDCDFMIVCLPPLKSQSIPVKLLAGSDMVIISANAARDWKQIDIQLLEMVEKIAGEKPCLVLSNVNTDNLKDYFGHIPIKTLVGRNRNKYS